MKFAVVEYQSKSGGIWRHTDSHPNYLADPQSEIDPTSFGCYVSALAGEHIPLTGLIVGPVNNMSDPGRFYRKMVKRLTGSWPAYSIDYLKQFDLLLVVHQLSDAHEMVRLLRHIKVARHRPFVIGVPTQPYGLLKAATDADRQARQNLIDFIKHCDVFISVVRSTVGWYEALSRTPVKYLPQPYPVSYATQFAQPRVKKDKSILVAGVTQRPNIRQGQLVARELQKKFPAYHILIPKVPDYNYDLSNLATSAYTVLPFEPWHDHLLTLANTMLVINTDYTQTRGRVQTDCAAVGTVSLGGNSDGQEDLFPALRSTPLTSTAMLIELGERLLTEAAFYDSLAVYAAKQLKKYDYPDSATRLLELL